LQFAIVGKGLMPMLCIKYDGSQPKTRINVHAWTTDLIPNGFNNLFIHGTRAHVGV
jgi:hypothetical protein